MTLLRSIARLAGSGGSPIVAGMKVLTAALALLAAALSAHAEVLVYKGTMKRYGPKEAVVVTSRPCYVVVGLATPQQVGFVSWYSAKGKKYHDRLDPLAVRIQQLPQVDGKVVNTYTVAQFTDLGSGAFVNEALFLHGLPVSLVVGAGNATDMEPKTLAGSHLRIAVGVGYGYDETSFALTYDKAHTIEANIAGRDAVTELNALIATLGALGY